MIFFQDRKFEAIQQLILLLSPFRKTLYDDEEIDIGFRRCRPLSVGTKKYNRNKAAPKGILT